MVQCIGIREPKLPHVLCGLSFCEACHFVRPIPVTKPNSSILIPTMFPDWVLYKVDTNKF